MNAIPGSDPIAHVESRVRSYANLFPTEFTTAKGSWLEDTAGRRYIDFFCGAGSLNYGHNHEGVKQALLAYIQSDGIQHSLDQVTSAKVRFVEAFTRRILKRRGLDYKLQFTGPTGTNAVEAAVKLAKKVKQRSHIVAFTHAYHGHSLGSLALTTNAGYHDEHYGSHNNVSHLPFDGYVEGLDSAAFLERMITDPSSGLPVPAAVILETVQGEGGINVASDDWLRRVAEICQRHDVLLIVDDIQVGNGRTGKFFSFEHAGITPDLVCLSKSLGGGLPLSLVLIQPDLDVWSPGEHTGTFRGNNLAFVAATALLNCWENPTFEFSIGQRATLIQQRLNSLRDLHSEWIADVRGRGMIWGVELRDCGAAKEVLRRAFHKGLLMEASGACDEVLKVMPALNISIEALEQGLKVLGQAIAEVSAEGTPEESSAPVALLADLSPAPRSAFPV